jgi:hypothetical protein
MVYGFFYTCIFVVKNCDSIKSVYSSKCFIIVFIKCFVKCTLVTLLLLTIDF